MAAVSRAEIAWSVVRTWEGTRDDERRLHRLNGSAKICPECAGPGALKRMKELTR